MIGNCPQCEMGLGNSPTKGRKQRFTEPVPLVKGEIPVELRAIVPHITMGCECGHTISLSAWQAAN